MCIVNIILEPTKVTNVLINSMITINGSLIPMAFPSILKLQSSFLKTTLLSCSATSCLLYNRTKHSRGYSRIFRLFQYPTIVVACSRLQPTTIVVKCQNNIFGNQKNLIFYKRSGNRVATLFCSTLCGSPAFNRLLRCYPFTITVVT